MVVCCHFTNLSQTALMVAISSSRVLGTACSHTSNDKAVVCLNYIGALQILAWLGSHASTLHACVVGMNYSTLLDAPDHITVAPLSLSPPRDLSPLSSDISWASSCKACCAPYSFNPVLDFLRRIDGYRTGSKLLRGEYEKRRGSTPCGY